jgi:transposase InsO family protein
VNEIDGRIGQNVLKTRVAPLDAEGVADGVERFLRASADGVNPGVWMPLIDRYELRAEAETNDCNAEDPRRWTRLRSDRFGLGVGRSLLAQPNPFREAATGAEIQVRPFGRNFHQHGVAVQRVMTDNGSAFRSRRYAKALRRLGVKHRRTRPYTPKTNGKAERFVQTSLREWAYARAYETAEQQTRVLRAAIRSQRCSADVAPVIH